VTAEQAGPPPTVPTPVGPAEIDAAAGRLGDRVRRTPVLALGGGDPRVFLYPLIAIVAVWAVVAVLLIRRYTGG